MDSKTKKDLHESPPVITIPLILLAIPSLIVGWVTIETVLFNNYFEGAIFVTGLHNSLQGLASDFTGSFNFLLHSLKSSPVFYLSISGVATSWFFYIQRPDIRGMISLKLSGLRNLLINKYYFDDLWVKGFAAGGRQVGYFLWKKGDELIIDGLIVNGIANNIRQLALILRNIQTGFLYHYAFIMIIGLTFILAWLLWYR